MSNDSAKGPTRRTFLKTSGLAAVSTVFAEAEPTSKKPSPPGQPHRDPVDWVNILQGTASTQEFSRGNTLPIAALPFGMAHWTMQSHEDTPWMIGFDRAFRSGDIEQEAGRFLAFVLFKGCG